MTFRNWEIIADRAYTTEVYRGIEGGIADGCECSGCQNFIHNRESIFPQEVKTLFAALGIDYTKESDNMYCQKKDGLHLYVVLYHFKGEIKNIQNENTFISLNEYLDINFGPPNGEIFFPSRENLSQVEFYIKMPWTRAKELETE